MGVKWSFTFFVWFLFAIILAFLFSWLIGKFATQSCLKKHLSLFIDFMRKAEEMPIGSTYIRFIEIEDCVDFVNVSGGKRICITAEGEAECFNSSIRFIFPEDKKEIGPGIYKVTISAQEIKLEK